LASMMAKSPIFWPGGAWKWTSMMWFVFPLLHLASNKPTPLITKNHRMLPHKRCKIIRCVYKVRAPVLDPTWNSGGGGDSPADCGGMWEKGKPNRPRDVVEDSGKGLRSRAGQASTPEPPVNPSE